MKRLMKIVRYPQLTVFSLCGAFMLSGSATEHLSNIAIDSIGIVIAFTAVRKSLDD